MNNKTVKNTPIFGALTIERKGDSLWLTAVRNEGLRPPLDFAIKSPISQPDLENWARSLVAKIPQVSGDAQSYIAERSHEAVVTDYLEEQSGLAIELGSFSPEQEPLEALQLVNVLIDAEVDTTVWTLDFAFSADFQTGLRDAVLAVKWSRDKGCWDLREEG